MTLTYTFPFGGFTVRCECTYTAGMQDMPDGDPGYPGDPEEFYVEKVELKLDNDCWLDVTQFWTELAEPFEFNDDLSISARAQLAKQERAGAAL